MAPRRHRRCNRALVVVYDFKAGHLVFKLNVARLFSPHESRAESRGRPQEILSLPPCPVARFQTPRRDVHMAFFASSPDGAKIFAVTETSGTVVYDTVRSESWAGPDLRASRLIWPILVTVEGEGGGREMLVTSSYPRSFTCRPPVRGSPPRGGRPLVRRRPRGSQSPFEAADYPTGPSLTVTCYFAAGARAWYSFVGKGTYSLDMASRVWREEGTWYLPVDDRAVHVPELGGLLFGFRDMCDSLCACDIRARPPVIVHEWDGLLPTEHEGYRFHRHPVAFHYPSLSYLGGGRFCVAWCSTAPVGDALGRRLFAVRAVQVSRGNGGELQLRRYKARCYLLSPGQQMGYML